MHEAMSWLQFAPDQTPGRVFVLIEAEPLSDVSH